MCGRYTETVNPEGLDVMIGLDACAFDFQPRYNIAPTQFAPVIVRDNGRTTLKGMRWGLVPSWADNEKIGNKLINARTETVAQKPAFKDAFKTRRCLVPADGFYEWESKQGMKQPWYFSLHDGEQFCFAGLWERWNRPPADQGDLFAGFINSDDFIETFTILTTTSNRLLLPVHDRMPVMMHPKNGESWLDGGVLNTQTIDSKLMNGLRVGLSVNNTDYDRPDCIQADLP